jgi:hypothetical protein
VNRAQAKFINVDRLSFYFQVLTAYCNMLHILRPAKAPGFSYAWLEIVSHRVFMGRILAATSQQKVSFTKFEVVTKWRSGWLSV